MSRNVQLSENFLLDVVRQFRSDRGPQGEPSAQDFFNHDLDAIMFIFAEAWDLLDLWRGHPHYRHRQIQGSMAWMYHVVGQQLPDGSIELIELAVDHNWPELP